MSHLHRAARRGEIGAVRLCLERGENVDAVSVHGFTALMLAAREGHHAIVETLLQAGADIRQSHANGRTALHFAAGAGHRAIVEVLLQAGAESEGCTVDEWLERYRLPVQLSQPFPRTEAMRASERELVRKLMADGLSPEEYAAREGRFVCIWSLGAEPFGDPEAEEWAREVQTILVSPERLAACEERFLQGDDLADARKRRAPRERKRQP